MVSQIDKIYIVHYKPLVVRKELLLRSLHANGITNYEFVEDFDRDTTPQSIKELYTTNPELNDAQICITISHFEIYKRILANDYKLCLILEDDALICDNFSEILQTYLSSFPSDCSVAFLNDGCNMHIPSTDIKPNTLWYKKQSTRTCCSYLITKEGCEQFLKHGLPFQEPIDFELHRIINEQNMNSYWCEPTIVTDGSGKLFTSSYARNEHKTNANDKHIGEQPKDLATFRQKIEANEPFVFAKFGDGEYNAARGETGENCDNTPYTERLGQSVQEAFRDLTQSSNVYIGRWQDTKGVDQYFQSLTDRPVQWLNYNNFIFKSRYEFMNTHYAFYKGLRHATQQKLYVCNAMMVERSKFLFNIDNHICVDPVNWFTTSYYEVLGNTIRSVTRPDECIILVSAGMGAKKLLSDLHKVFPRAIMIDLGSALDLLCSGRRSRDFHNLSQHEFVEITNAILN